MESLGVLSNLSKRKTASHFIYFLSHSNHSATIALFSLLQNLYSSAKLGNKYSKEVKAEK